MPELDELAPIAPDAPADEIREASIDEGTDLVVRSMDRREIECRIALWGQVAETPIGLETFLPGAFADVDPRRVVLRLEHENPPAGVGVRIEERSDGAYMVLRASQTPRGDEILTLANDGVTPHVSVGYAPRTTLGDISYRDGRRVTQIRKCDLRELSTTWMPAYSGTAVLAVRTEGEGPVPEPQEAAVAAEPFQPQIDLSPVTAAIASLADNIGGRVAELEERSRRDIIIPGHVAQEPGVTRGRWMQNVLRSLAGERVSELEMRAMADLVTGDNLGVVPEAFSPELIGVIERNRPFLETTRRVPTPESGMTLNMPKIVTRPTTGVQVNEKDDITSTATSITNEGFDAVTIAGGGDLSLQILRRSSPSYLDLYIELLAEALGENAEDEAVAALLDAGVTAGTGAIDPEALTIGEAWTNARAARQRADTIWLSSAGVEAFIDAKASGTNAPLYSSFAADITVAGGARGSISGLRPVYVPALDDTAVDVLVGPSRGFAWAEDGTYNLQVDVPSKAGRDVALVSIFFFAPMYPTAFTSYAL